MKKEVEELIKKIEEIKKGEVDLSSDEDLSLALMNLISIEEHFFFTGVKTNKNKYFDLLNKTRELRKELMKKLIKNPEGEIWCISKHLLGASMRLIEVGTKYYNQGKRDEAQDLFNKAYDLWTLFWGLNLNIINIGEIKQIEDDQLNIKDNEKTGFLGSIKKIIQKIIDCCIE